MKEKNIEVLRHFTRDVKEIEAQGQEEFMAYLEVEVLAIVREFYDNVTKRKR